MDQIRQLADELHEARQQVKAKERALLEAVAAEFDKPNANAIDVAKRARISRPRVYQMVDSARNHTKR